jgi:hypothetical protein
MKGACYILAIAMMIGWLVGMIFFKPASYIHILVLTGAICWMQGIILSPKSCGKSSKMTLGQAA